MNEKIIELSEAFARRENRLALLDKGIRKAGWDRASLKLLELGCGDGNAAAFVSEQYQSHVTAVDADAYIISIAREKEREHCQFLLADARELPFKENMFDGIYSEAFFSGVADTPQVLREVSRVLKPGGRYLLNDFYLKTKPTAEREASGIPCFEGAQTRDNYIELFESVGMVPIVFEEKFFEFASIVQNLCRVYNTTSAEISKLLAMRFGTVKQTNADILAGATLSYCQMIFEKR